MKVPTLKAKRRTELGTRNTRRLRTQGSLPGIVYGHGETPVAISVSTHDLLVHLHHGVRMLDVVMGSRKTHCLIKEVQYDHLDKEPIHIDLTRVDLKERVTVNVAVVLRGTPKGAEEGGVVEQLLSELEIECQVTEIPETLHVNIAELGVGDALLVKDIELPSGAKAMNDAEDRVAIIRVPTEAAEPEEAPEEEGSAEPERIGRVAEEPQEDSGKSSS